MDIVQVAVVIGNPASEGSKVVLVPLTLGFALPCLFVTGSETDACLAVEVDADGNFLIFIIEYGENITIL